MSENVKQLYLGKLGIEYGQFYFDSPDDEDDYPELEEAFTDQKNGICGAATPGKVFFITGIQNGTISVLIELFSICPPVDDEYDEVVEVAFFNNGSAPIHLCQWGHEWTRKLDLPKGHYRIRYSIQGMDKDYDEDDNWDAPIPGQRHMIQLWPQDQQEDEVVKLTSEMAKYWHEEQGCVY